MSEFLEVLNEFKVAPFGILVGHTWEEVGVIVDLINAFEIKGFVEVGVHAGGLAALLAHSTEHIPGFRYLGIEINASLINTGLKKVVRNLPNAAFIFDDAYKSLTTESVRGWLSINRKVAAEAPRPRSFIYCDGGDKPRGFQHYGPLLEVGDLIAAHDYDYGGYARAEIKDADMEETVALCGLKRIVLPGTYRIAAFRKVS